MIRTCQEGISRRELLRLSRGVALSCPLGTLQEAVPPPVRLMAIDSTPSTRLTVAALATRLPCLRAEAERLPGDTNPTAVIAVGASALETAMPLARGGPVLALNVSNEQYRAIEQTARNGGRHAPITAIYSEPSPTNQMKLIRSIFRREVRVGVLLSRNTAHLDLLLRQAAASSELKLQVERVDEDSDVVSALNQLRPVHVLLAIPDRVIYKVENLRDILEATYRHETPVIGFSSSMVRAGTLATVYSSPDDIAAQVGGLLPQLAAGRLVPPQYPAYWRVAINEYVARSIDIAISNDTRSLAEVPP